MPLTSEQIAVLQNGSSTGYGTVDINGVTYPTKDVGNLEVTCANFTFANLASVANISGLTQVVDANGWLSAVSSNTPAFGFAAPTTLSLNGGGSQIATGLTSDLTLSRANTTPTGLVLSQRTVVTRGALFNGNAIAVINAYLATNHPGWRVLTECDAKHMKNAWSYPGEGGYGGCVGSIRYNAIQVAASEIDGNEPDRCLAVTTSPGNTSNIGLGVAISSASVIAGIPLNTNFAGSPVLNATGYSSVITGFINSSGNYDGAANSNIWTSTDCGKQYAVTSVSTLAQSLQAATSNWRGFANFVGIPIAPSVPTTFVDHLPNNRADRGFAIRLCRTKVTPYAFAGNHDVPADTGTLVAGQAIVAVVNPANTNTDSSTVTSTVAYTNSMGTWRINKCADTVNGITARAGTDLAPGWDKLLSPDPGSGGAPVSGNIIVRFSGTPIAAGTFTWNLPIGCQTISITRTVEAPGPDISTLNCAGASGTLTQDIIEGIAVSPGTTFTVTYTGGNGGTYPLQTFNSTGVTGLVATLAAGTLSNGNGSLTFTVTGTASAAGTAVFPITFAGASCNANITVDPDIGTITGLTGCTNATLINGPLVANTAVAPGTSFTINYQGNNGLTFNPQTVTSTGVTGLTATFAGGTFPSGNGTFSFTITGTPVGSGTASFAVSFPSPTGGTVTCTVTLNVDPDGPAITSLICSPTNLTGGPILEGVAISGASFTISYNGGNGLPYSGQTITSTGVTGITATLSAGTLANGSGQLTYNLSGTPADNGTAAFLISFSTPTGDITTCVVTVPVTPVILISYLGCDNATYSPSSPPYTVNTPISTNVSIPYTSTQGGILAAVSFTSSGVSGLTLTLNSTTVQDNANGVFTGTISGTPTQTGNAVFTICVGGYLGQGQTCCTLTIPIEIPPPTIGTLECQNASFNGQIQYPQSYSVGNNITLVVPYTDGNGGAYPYTSATSTGVTGLTIYTGPGNFAGSPSLPQNGTFTFTVIGTPSGPGVANFTINIGGQTCEISLTVTNLPGTVNSLNCTGATTNIPVQSGQSVSGITVSIPYTGGNGGFYNTQVLQSIPSGVFATLPAGNLVNGNGTLQLSLSGTMPVGFIPVTFLFPFPEGSAPCTVILTPPVGPGTADLDCNSLIVAGSVTYPDPIPANNPIILYINYDNSNGGSYNAATFPSSLAFNGVAGLTASLAAGQFQLGSGTLQLTVTGTPQSSGIAYFDVTIGGTTCTLEVPVGAPAGEIDTLNCEPSSISVTGTLTNGSPAVGVTFTVPYIGSNGGTYSGNTVNSSSIVTGLTATLGPGLFNQPNGSVTYTVSGTPLGSGPATFPITVANQSCIILLTVDPIPGTADLDCANSTFSANPVQGFSTLITGGIPYTNGNGGYYDPYTDTVDGLTLTINEGYFNNGSGSVPFTISGTSTVSGPVTFTNIQVGDQTCNLTIIVSDPPPIIDDLLCDQAVISGSLVINQSASGVTITIPYNGSNEQPYPEDSSNSTGIPGLVATTPAGTLTDPTGVLVYTVTGTPLASGVATFTITIGTQTCVISIPVSPPNFFGPSNPSPCQEVTYNDPGCEVLATTCTILLNGTEVSYSTLSTTDPCQVSFQVPCDTEPNSIAEVTFLDCEDNIITIENLPIGDVLPAYLLQNSGCPTDQVSLIDTGCIYVSQVDNIEVCSTLGCVSVNPATITVFNNPPLPCILTFNLPATIPVAFYPAPVQIVFNSVSGELLSLDYELQNCGTAENSFNPIQCALPNADVTFTNPGCDIVNPDLTSILVDGVSATITDINTTFPCSVSFVLPVGAGPGPVDVEFFDILGNVLGTETYSIAAEGVGSLYTVTFTPQTEGCHRIYFRTTEVEYCYYQAEGPFEIGVPVTVTIDLQDYAECLVTTPPTSCDLFITVNGYIQPCCNAEDSLDNRVELNCVQYLTTDCGLYSVECLSSNCGTFTKSNCFASGCTGINDLTEYAFRGNDGIPDNKVYVCSEGNGVQNTTNSTYTITKLSSIAVKVYGTNVLAGWPFSPINWTTNANALWNAPVACPYTGDHIFVNENTGTGTVASGLILVVGTTYEFTFSMYSNLPNTINFTSGIGNTVSVSSPGGFYPPVGTTYQITAQAPGRLTVSIPSVGKGTCFQLTGLRAVQTGVRATCCTCFGAEVEIEFPEEGPYSIDVYYTQCTDDGPQIATATLTNTFNIVNCCTYGSVFPVNKFDIQYITSILYTDTSNC